jgi:lysophospholipase L1-like esterase
MTATGHASRIRTLELIALSGAVAALVAGAAGPAAAEPKAALSYVALGDSYASGFGAGSYVNLCGQTPLGLPGILDGKKQIDLVADATCAGAKAVSEPAGALDLPEQVTRVVAAGALSRDTDLVTISAGGNDVGFGEVAGVCAVGSPADCANLIAFKNATVLPVLGNSLDALYDSIESAAPDADVVVTGYPHLFSPEFGVPVIPVESQTAFNAGTDALNTLIRSQAEAHGFTFLDVVPKFEGHGLGSPSPWITFRANADDNLHPTAEGYKSAYFPAFRSAVNIAQLQR